MGFTRPLVILAALVSGAATFGQGQKVAYVSSRDSGSNPPPGAFDRCIWDLMEKPYSQAKTQRCARQIRSWGYFEKVRVETSPADDGNINVVFVLKAPELRLTELDLSIGDVPRQELREWLARNPRTLNVGDIYDSGREVATRAGLDTFFSSRGKEAGISSKLFLDTKRRTARLALKVAEGPPIAPMSVPPPWTQPCLGPRVSVQNWMDVDDAVPMALARRLVRLPDGYACYSETTVRSDEATLKQSGLFDEVEFAVAGSADYREVSIHLRGKPLTVRRIDVEGYGLLAGTVPQDHPLPLRAGEIYSRRKAGASLARLKQIYTRPGWNLTLRDDASLSGPQQIDVRLQVLAYDEHQVFLNGKPIPTSKPSYSRPGRNTARP